MRWDRLEQSLEARFDAFRAERVSSYVRRRRDRILLSLEDAHGRIRAGILSGRGFLLARPGLAEASWTNFVLRHRIMARHPAHPPEKLLTQGESDWTKEMLVGLDRFCVRYATAAIDADVLAHWTDPRRPGLEFSSLCVGGQAHVRAEDISPFLAHQAGVVPWTQALRGLRVLVIHPYLRSIESQWALRGTVTMMRDIMPEATLEVLRPPVLSLGRTNHWLEDDRWRLELSRTLEESARRSYDVALVAAGPLGLLIADGIRTLGRPAVHVGGLLQLLFGIRGSRWEQGGGSFMDETWVRPHPEDVPQAIRALDGGAYL